MTAADQLTRIEADAVALREAIERIKTNPELCSRFLAACARLRSLEKEVRQAALSFLEAGEPVPGAEFNPGRLLSVVNAETILELCREPDIKQRAAKLEAFVEVVCPVRESIYFSFCRKLGIKPRNKDVERTSACRSSFSKALQAPRGDRARKAGPMHRRASGRLPSMSVTERAQRYLAACDPAISGSGGHDTTFRVACTLLRGFRLSPTEAFRLLKIYNEKCQPPWSDSELRHKIVSAAGVGSSKRRGYLLSSGALAPSFPSSPVPGWVSCPPSPQWPAPALEEIDYIVRNGPGAYEVWEDAPCRWQDEASHTEEIIDVVFPGDPLLCVGWASWHFETRRRSAWRGLLAEMPLLVPAPMVTPSGLTKDGKRSQHTLAATARRIYQVIEFDFSKTDRNGAPTIWAPLLAGWEADGISTLDACAALSSHLAKLLPAWLLFLSSGGKSGHSWFNVRGLPISEQRAFFAEACRLGADPKLWGRS